MDKKYYLVVKCPNFYYMPSLWYDKVFIKVDDAIYWKNRNYSVYELIEVNESEATHYLKSDLEIIEKGKYSINLENEWVLAGKAAEKTVWPVKLLLI